MYPPMQELGAICLGPISWPHTQLKPSLLLALCLLPWALGLVYHSARQGCAVTPFWISSLSAHVSSDLEAWPAPHGP